MEVEGLERTKVINHFNYTDDQLAEKELCLKQLAIIYPNVNKYYAELVYDLCKNTSDEQMEILKQKALEPFKYKDRYKTLQEELDNKPKIYIDELAVSQTQLTTDVSGNIENIDI